MKTILLVEDDPFLVDIYMTKLKEVGFDVLSATDGKEAIRKIREERPELVLLDIVLPKMDGWGILQEIRTLKRENKELADLKIVILSNLGQKEEVEKGLKLGAEKYFIKAHYTPSEVAEEINKLFK